METNPNSGRPSSQRDKFEFAKWALLLCQYLKMLVELILK